MLGKFLHRSFLTLLFVFGQIMILLQCGTGSCISYISSISKNGTDTNYWRVRYEGETIIEVKGDFLRGRR